MASLCSLSRLLFTFFDLKFASSSNVLQIVPQLKTPRSLRRWDGTVSLAGEASPQSAAARRYYHSMWNAWLRIGVTHRLQLQNRTNFEKQHSNRCVVCPSQLAQIFEQSEAQLRALTNVFNHFQKESFLSDQKAFSTWKLSDAFRTLSENLFLFQTLSMVWWHI